MLLIGPAPGICAFAHDRFSIPDVVNGDEPEHTNSGVMKGDVSTGHMDWYGVVQRIIALDFPNGKEVVLFQCDWYDVPSDPNKKGRGYKKD
jgi:hypothetical protein